MPSITFSVSNVDDRYPATEPVAKKISDLAREKATKFGVTMPKRISVLNDFFGEKVTMGYSTNDQKLMLILAANELGYREPILADDC